MNRQNTQTQQAKLLDSQRRQMRHKAPVWPIWATVTEPEVKPARPIKVSGVAPNPNRRLDEALKLLYKNGKLIKEVIQRGKKRSERFFIVNEQGRFYKVRKKIANLLFNRQALEKIIPSFAVKGIFHFILSQVGKAWASQVLPVKAAQ